MLVFLIVQRHKIDDASPGIHSILYKRKIYSSIVSLLNTLMDFLPKLGSESKIES